MGLAIVIHNVVFYLILVLLSLGMLYIWFLFKRRGNDWINIKYICNQWTKYLRYNNKFQISKVGISLLLPDQLRSLYWNEQRNFLLNASIYEKGYQINIDKINIVDNEMMIELEVKSKKGDNVRINKTNATIMIDKSYKIIVEGNEKNQYILHAKGINIGNIFADTDIKINIKVTKRENLDICIKLPLENKGIIENIKINDYLGFCSFGGFVGIGSIVGAIVCFLLLFIQNELIGAGILFWITLLTVALGLNKRLYALIRNNM